MKTQAPFGHSRDVTASVLLLLVLAVDQVWGPNSGLSLIDRINKANKEMEYVDKIASSGNCTAGTGNVLNLPFNTSYWGAYIELAIRTANYVAKLLAERNNTLESVPEDILYNFVLNNVQAHGNTIIGLLFASGIALEAGVLNASSHTLFCPYAYKHHLGQLQAFDLALSYDYTSNETEWYAKVREKDFSGVEVALTSVAYGTAAPLIRTVPVVNQSHGRWTFPYYDCGGGDVWMVTYSAPILALSDQGVPVFKGVATIDLELTHIDINQCDSETSDQAGSLDFFRDTHSCQPNTKCVHITGRGLTLGSYRCECLDGYYLPNTNASIQAFTAAETDNVTSSLLGSSATHGVQCMQCQRGCDWCVDDTPCLYEYNRVARITVVVIVIFLILGSYVLSFFVFKYRKELVIKTASPVFLQIMIAGAIFMYLSALMRFPEPSDLWCTLSVWPFHLGFVLLYGSLLLKTWRISVIFNSHKQVNLTDNVLLLRLTPLLAAMVSYLACWSALDPPKSILVTMADTKMFFSCHYDNWDICIFGAEAVMLLFGVYLCYNVRNTPAHFNESKCITWSIYNAITLGSFLHTLEYFVSTPGGPDVVYFLLLLELQVFCTTVLGLICIPKLWALYYRIRIPLEDITGLTSVSRSRSVFEYKSQSHHPELSVSTQTTAEDLGYVPPPAVSNAVQPSSGLGVVPPPATSSAVRPSSGLGVVPPPATSSAMRPSSGLGVVPSPSTSSAVGSSSGLEVVPSPSISSAVGPSSGLEIVPSLAISSAELSSSGVCAIEQCRPSSSANPSTCLTQ